MILDLKGAFPDAATREGDEHHGDVVAMLLVAEAEGLTNPPPAVELQMPVFPTKAEPFDVSKIDGIPDQAASLFSLLTL